MYTHLLFGVTLISIKWSTIWCKNIENSLLPCDVEDSIDLTGGTYLLDNSVLFNGIKYSKENFGTFYSTVNRTKTNVNAHLRGCPCKIRPCLRLCCAPGELVNTSALERGTILQKIPCYQHEAAKNLQSEVFDENTNQTEIQLLDEHFSYVVVTSPKKFYKLKKFQITNMGNIKRHNLLLTHHDYCIQADLNKTGDSIELSVLAFFNDVDQLPFKYIWSSICMLTSVPFIAVTILIYMLLPELHNLHGNCLMCYLICLGIGYSFTAWIKLDEWNYVTPLLCSSCGYFMYFFLFSAFLWSNVISFDLWQNLRTTNTYDQCCERENFRIHMVFVWGCSSFLTVLLVILDFFKLFRDELLPGVGVQTCFLQKKTSILYFYTPLLIISIVNIIYFISTALKIRRVQYDVAKMTSEKESMQNNLNNNVDNLKIFVRLFIVMGVAWIFEGLSFLIDNDNDSHFFTIFDAWNALQGPIIFFSFIMRRRVLFLIKKRYHEFCGKASVQTDIVCENSCVKLNEFNSHVFDDNSNVLSSNINSTLRF